MTKELPSRTIAGLGSREATDDAQSEHAVTPSLEQLGKAEDTSLDVDSLISRLAKVVRQSMNRALLVRPSEFAATYDQACTKPLHKKLWNMSKNDKGKWLELYAYYDAVYESLKAMKEEDGYQTLDEDALLELNQRACIAANDRLFSARVNGNTKNRAKVDVHLFMAEATIALLHSAIDSESLKKPGQDPAR